MQIQSDSDRAERCTCEGFSIDKKYVLRISQADFTAIILYHTYLSIASRERRMI